jgi:hypothetical protein
LDVTGILAEPKSKQEIQMEKAEREAAVAWKREQLDDLIQPPTP